MRVEEPQAVSSGWKRQPPARACGGAGQRPRGGATPHAIPALARPPLHAAAQPNEAQLPAPTPSVGETARAPPPMRLASSHRESQASPLSTRSAGVGVARRGAGRREARRWPARRMAQPRLAAPPPCRLSPSRQPLSSPKSRKSSRRGLPGSSSQRAPRRRPASGRRVGPAPHPRVRGWAGGWGAGALDTRLPLVAPSHHWLGFARLPPAQALLFRGDRALGRLVGPTVSREPAGELQAPGGGEQRAAAPPLGGACT